MSRLAPPRLHRPHPRRLHRSSRSLVRCRPHECPHAPPCPSSQHAGRVAPGHPRLRGAPGGVGLAAVYAGELPPTARPDDLGATSRAEGPGGRDRQARPPTAAVTAPTWAAARRCGRDEQQPRDRGRALLVCGGPLVFVGACVLRLADGGAPHHGYTYDFLHASNFRERPTHVRHERERGKGVLREMRNIPCTPERPDAYALHDCASA